MMKLSKLVSLLIFPFLFVFIIFPSQQEHLPPPPELAQSKKKKNDQLMENKARELLNFFFNKEFEQVRKMISPKLQEQISLQLLKKEWVKTASENGSFKDILRSKVIETPTSYFVTITVNGFRK